MSRARWIVIGTLAVILTGTAAGAPKVLRRWDAFTVERVEVRGTRYLAAYDALVQSGITRSSNIFDDFGPWRDKLLAHPLVLGAEIERHLPHTIRVAITETEPVALARTPDLVPVDVRGRALPIDPAAVDLDVPLLAFEARPNADGVFADDATQDLVRVLAMLQRRDARLFSWVSEAAPVSDGVRLTLRSPAGAQALLPADARALRLAELQIALADLAARGELNRLERIDARFHDQIVVALNGEN
jgi:cell division septal protein FtsQ